MDLLKQITEKDAVVAVIGLGYVGLPLLMAFSSERLKTIGYDISQSKVDQLASGKSYIKHFTDDQVSTLVNSGRNKLTTSVADLAEADVLLICVPTPLTAQRTPEMSYITSTTESLSTVLREGQLVILESTTYPGTTRELVVGILDQNTKGLKAGVDFHVAYSPEREDPGNKKYNTQDIPKVVGGLTPLCGDLAEAIYAHIVPKTIRVSSTDVAESTKLLENIFRSINIAMINELKVVFDAMDINVWEVIEAASTKPFGFMPFYPGPGLGGHCIPIDPFYLTWKARQYEMDSRFIELSGEINSSMPQYVVSRLMKGLNEHCKSLKGSKVLILGLAYKSDVDDCRESPALKLIELILEYGAEVDYHDSNVPVMKKSRNYDFSMSSVELTAENLSSYDAVLISTKHSDVDYQLLADHCSLVIDTRNAMKDTIASKAEIIMA